MKYVKMLGLAAVAAAALMAFVGSSTASAAVLCSATESPCSATNKLGSPTKLGFSLESGASAILTNTSGEELDKCTGSIVTGELNSSSTGTIETLDWTPCTFTTTTVSGFAGKLEVTGPLTGTSNGTVKSDAEIRVTISIPFFGSCVYGVTSGTSLGTLKEGNPAHFEPNALAERLSGSSISCPLTSLWKSQGGEYVATEPNTTISVSSS